jgi:uncharacterized NAD-dependent epimerase/dehydratase family protein
MAIIRYGDDKVVAAVDRSKVPSDASEYIGPVGQGIPVVRSIGEALRFEPEMCVFGWAPVGGGLPEHDKHDIITALRAGVDVVSGLHDFLKDDPDIWLAAQDGDASIIDLRRPPEERHILTGEGIGHKAPVVLVSGTDCSTGKMTVAVEMVREARKRGMDAAFIATGQSGMLIGADQGVAIDALTGDFMSGEVERMVMEADQLRPDLIVVEGQGALSHPAYGAVSLAILLGSYPNAVVMCHDPGREYFSAFSGAKHSATIPPLKNEIDFTERVTENTTKGRVAAIAVMAVEEDKVEMTRVEAIITKSLGLPVSDVFRDGPGPLLDYVMAFLEKGGGGSP